MTKMFARLIDQRGYESEYGIPVDTQEKQRARGEGPPWIKIGRKYYYRREQLELWLDEQQGKTVAAKAPEPNDTLATTLAKIIRTTPTGEETRKRIAELLGGTDDAA